MNSNSLGSLKSLPTYFSLFSKSPEQIRFIDLSINEIEDISPLRIFCNLSYLYLHSNNIKSFRSIRPLSALNLSNLTLHGNPIEEHKHYRNLVLHLFPNLVKLDFGLVIKQDRENCKTWAKTFRNKLNKEYSGGGWIIQSESNVHQKIFSNLSTIGGLYLLDYSLLISPYLQYEKLLLQMLPNNNPFLQFVLRVRKEFSTMRKLHMGVQAQL